jgi:hypothetical protein
VYSRQGVMVHVAWRGNISGAILVGKFTVTHQFGNSRSEDTIKMDIRNCELIANNSPQISTSTPQFGMCLFNLLFHVPSSSHP